MAEVRYTTDARNDLESIVDSLASYSPNYALSFIDRLEAAAESLQQFPLLGRLVPEFEEESLREVIIDSYRVVYRIRGQVIQTVGLAHGSQRIERFLEDR